MLEGDQGSGRLSRMDTLLWLMEVGTPRVQENGSSGPSPREGMLEREDLQGKRAGNRLGVRSSVRSFISREMGGERGRSLMNWQKHGGQIMWRLVCHAKEFRLGLQTKTIQLQNHSNRLLCDGKNRTEETQNLPVIQRSFVP